MPAWPMLARFYHGSANSEHAHKSIVGEGTSFISRAAIVMCEATSFKDRNNRTKKGAQFVVLAIYFVLQK